MGCQLSAEQASYLAVNDLGLDEADLQGWQLKDDHIECLGLVEEKWLQELHAGKYTKPSSYPGSSYERFLFLQKSNKEIPKPWTRVVLKIYKKPLKSLRIPKVPSDFNFPCNDTFADLMSYVSTENFKNYLLQASKKYSSTPLNGDVEFEEISGKDISQRFAGQLFNLKVIKLNHSFAENSDAIAENSHSDKNFQKGDATELFTQQRLSGLLTIYGILESESAYFVLEPFAPHSLQDVVWFSPSIISSTVTKPLFLFYQILKLFETFHALGYYCTVNSLRNIFLGNCLWLHLSAISANVGDLIAETSHTNGESSPGLEVAKCDLNLTEIGAYDVSSPFQKLGLPELIERWVKKEISNFDYLMALNFIAGRRPGDPNYHPVLPWVTDFTSPNGKYRDLTKSKFRINKGDFQLDVTFKNVSDSDEDLTENPPHHVSGVLSEITYHVYLARRTPKSVLQKHVRAKWEPNEYPANMQRLQEWTPDECIPEFYTDSTIFESIHGDLPDLGVPTWAESPDEFIRLHRKALESDYVCDHLHDWIDLTFGYKLVGVAAEKAKNVYLHLVDQHQTISSHGVVQLFEQPHPKQHRHHDMVLYPSMVNLEDGLEHEMRDVSNEAQIGYVEEGQAEILCDEILPSSWDDVDLDMKVETAQDELSASSSLRKLKQWPRPSFAAFLRLKDNVETNTDILPSIDSLPISLPIGYGPLEQFDQVELLTKFKLQAKQNELPVAKDLLTKNEVAVLPRSEIPETARHKEIQNLCTMVIEMFLPAKMRLLSFDMSQKERFMTAKRVFNSGKVAVPGILRDGLKTLFDEGCGFHKRQGFPPLTPELLLQQHVNIIPFPSYFKRLYEFLVEFHLGNPITSSLALAGNSNKNIAITNTLNDVSYTLAQVEIAVQHLPDLLAELNGEGLDLLISYLAPLFSDEKTQLQAFLHLFDPLADSLGPKRTKKTFLKQLLKHYDVRMSNASVVLFHQSFLSKLIMRFGMDQFLDHFLSFIVDALNLSGKDAQLNVDTTSQDEVQGVVLVDDKELAENVTREPQVVSNGEEVQRQLGQLDEEPVFEMSQELSKDKDCNVAQKVNAEENGNLVQTQSEYSDNVDGLSSSTVHSQENVLSVEEQYGEFSKMDEFSSGKACNGDGDNGHVGDDDDYEEETIERNDAIFQKPVQSVSLLDSDDDWERVADSDFSFERSVSFHSEHLDHKSEDGDIDEDIATEREIPEAAAESICWLSPRLGPLLTSNHIIKPLLGMLVKCYVGVVAMGDKGISTGYTNAKWILHCLAYCTEIYGEAVIVHQYMPFVLSKINILSQHVSVKGEANLAGALVLVRQYMCSISKDSLAEQFETLCYQAVDQVLCLVSSATITFASEAPSRTFLALLILDILKVICDIFERSAAQDLLSPLIATFFSCFASCGSPIEAEKSGSSKQPCAKEISDTFNAWLAYNAYIPLCKCLGDTYMTATLDKNHDMIWQLCCSVDGALSNHTPSPTFQPVFVLSDEESSIQPRTKVKLSPEKNPTPEVESRKDAKNASLERAASAQMETRTKSTFVSSRQHLTGHWLKYWKHHLEKRKGIDGSTFLKLRLQTFAGHSDVVKDIHIEDSEHLFLSASRDKTVKLWLLRNHGDGTGQSACSWTTYDHRKPVFAVNVIDVLRQAVSCDGSVHIWDLPTGSSVLRLNFPKSKEAVAMATLPCPSPCVVAGMQNGTVRFIDAREGNFGHTWKVTSNSLAGHIRSLCVTEDGTSMAVGFSSGFLSLVDLRGGILTRQWKAHEADIIQVKPYTNSSFVTSSSTQKMELWGHDAASLCSLPTLTGSGESIQSIRVHDKVIVSMAGNNRIAWHTFPDKEPTYTHLRLGNDIFKGNMTCFGVLPLNRGYLLGSDNGNITLMG